MADFQWEESHVKWFSKTFTGRKELSARDVEKRYHAKKGESKKRSPIGDEQTIDAQDFRNLMRLMVIHQLARVTRDFCESSGYRIRMVSDEYPYKLEIFDKEIFNNPFLANPIPFPEELQNNYLETLKINWNSLANSIWSLTVEEGRKHLAAFYAYNYLGGDFDVVFDRAPFLETLNDSETKGLFVRQSLLFINIYKAYKVGKLELIEDCKINSPHGIPEDYNSFFIVTFRSDMIKRFLFAVERPTVHVSDRTLYNNFRKVLRQYEKGEEVSEEFMRPLMRGTNYSEDTLYYVDIEDGKNWRRILARSERAEVKTALKDVEDAYRELENFRLRCYRANGSTTTT